MLSVSAILVDAGVRVIGGNAHAVTYRDGSRPVTAEIRKYDEVPSSLPSSEIAPRLLVACASASSRARAQALARGDVDLVVEHRVRWC